MFHSGTFELIFYELCQTIQRFQQYKKIVEIIRRNSYHCLIENDSQNHFQGDKMITGMKKIRTSYENERLAKILSQFSENQAGSADPGLAKHEIPEKS